MSYKTYRVQEEDAVYLRTTTDGYQPKFLVDQGRRFLKVQCELNRTLRDDWRVEDIASRICDRYGIYAVHQTPCRVMIGTRRGELQRMGVVSDNFAAQGYQFLSFSTLLQLDKSDRPDFRKLDAVAKLDFMEQVMCTVTGISHERIREYLYQMVFVDLLVLNPDRHLKNMGVFYKIDQKRVVREHAQWIRDYLDQMGLKHYDFEEMIKKMNGWDATGFHWVRFPDTGATCWEDILTQKYPVY